MVVGRQRVRARYGLATEKEDDEDNGRKVGARKFNWRHIPGVYWKPFSMFITSKCVPEALFREWWWTREKLYRPVLYLLCGLQQLLSKVVGMGSGQSVW